MFTRAHINGRCRDAHYSTFTVTNPAHPSPTPTNPRTDDLTDMFYKEAQNAKQMNAAGGGIRSREKPRFFMAATEGRDLDQVTIDETKVKVKVSVRA